MNPSTDTAQLEALVTTMSERMATLTRTLGTWVQEAPRDLQMIEEHVLRLVKELGATLVAGLCSLLTPVQPARTVPCPCGHTALYQRLRPATVTTILGPISVARPYYLCASCGQGHHPLDADLDLCAGSRSAGLDELLALLGATQDSFAEATAVLERLTLVHVSPNGARDAPETLGAVLLAEQAQHATACSVRKLRPKLRLLFPITFHLSRCSFSQAPGRHDPCSILVHDVLCPWPHLLDPARPHRRRWALGARESSRDYAPSAAAAHPSA